MKTRKRILSFLLAVCLTLTAAIPAVFALEGEGGVLTYKFGIDSTVKTGKTTGAAANPYTGENSSAYALISGDGYLLNNSNPSRGFTIGDSSILARYNEGTNAWFAIKITGISGVTYDMTFHFNNGASSGSLAKVYVVKSDVYKTVLAGTDMADTLTTDENTEFIAALYTNNGVVNEGNEKVLDCYKCDALVKNQSIGKVTFPTSGEYVLIFQSAGSSPNNTGGATYQFQVESLTMTPVVEESIQVSDADGLKNALSAAESDSTVVLSNAITVEEALTVPANVTLNLAGKTLTVNGGVECAGAVIDDSEDSAGVLNGSLTVSGDNGGYLPISTAKDTYKFYKVTVTATNVDTGVANTMKLKFQVKFDKDAAYVALAAGTSGATIGGIFTWTGNENQMHDITYSDGTPLAQKWGQEVVNHSYNKNGSIVLSFSGTDAFDGLTVVPYIRSAGATIKAA